MEVTGHKWVTEDVTVHAELQRPRPAPALSTDRLPRPIAPLHATTSRGTSLLSAASALCCTSIEHTLVLQQKLPWHTASDIRRLPCTQAVVTQDRLRLARNELVASRVDRSARSDVDGQRITGGRTAHRRQSQWLGPAASSRITCRRLPRRRGETK